MVAEIKVLNERFESAGSLQTGVALSPDVISVPCVHSVVNALRASRRQGTACVKNRAVVRGGGAKPFKQKGTGRARQGSNRSPLMPGGGVVFGPVPRSYEQKVNKKVRLIALRSVLADKFQAGKLTVLEKMPLEKKTKDLCGLLKEKGLFPALLVTENVGNPVLRAARNLKVGAAVSVGGFCIYTALRFENLIIEKGAIEKLLLRLEKLS